MSDLPHILVVDDEPFNIEIIMELLEEAGLYRMSSAEDGEIALKMMEENPEDFDVVLLDRMMPNMNGLDVLAKMKQHDVLRHCPVIFQTAKISNAEITEGLKAGAYYYLSKPFDSEVLLSVVQTAVQDRIGYKVALAELDKNNNLMSLLKKANFEFKTIDEARNLASLLSYAFPEPMKVIMGLTELMVNAVEHGNLAITYDEKSMLNSQGGWGEEINKRLALPEYEHRKVSIDVGHIGDTISIIIKDEGEGFDWQTYMDFDPSRVMDNHGRGIAIANKMSFTSIEYMGIGNEVHAKLKKS